MPEALPQCGPELPTLANLFWHCKMELPVYQPRCGASVERGATVVDKKYGHLRLICANEIVAITTVHPPRQYFLEFMDRSDSNVVKLVPRSRYPYLSYGVYDSFSHNPELRKAATILEDLGYRDIGRLIQSSEAELISYPFMTESILAAMKTQLKQAKLEFGMTAPGWERVPTINGR